MKQADSVDMVLEGFGAARPDRGRILPQKSETPIPAPVKPGRPEGGSTTHASMRKVQRRRQAAFGLVIGVCILGAILVAWKMSSPGTSEQPVQTSTNATLPPPPTNTTTTTNVAPTIQPIPVENLAPVATNDTAPKPTVKAPATAKPTASAPVGTATAPTGTTAPTSSGPDPKNDVKRTM